jgi:hypothetical protein
LLRDRPNGDAVRRPPTNLHRLASSPSRLPLRGIATARSRARTGRLCTVPGFSSGAGLERSPLHDVRQHAREGHKWANPPGKPLSANRCTSGRAASLRTQRCESTRRATGAASISGTYGRQSGGARRDRTDDLLLAKQALSQLSYGPVRNQRSAFDNREAD